MAVNEILIKYLISCFFGIIEILQNLEKTKLLILKLSFSIFIEIQLFNFNYKSEKVKYINMGKACGIC